MKKKQLTIDNFLRRLRRRRHYKWRIARSSFSPGLIRCDGERRGAWSCPITAVDSKINSPCLWREVAKKIGLSPSDANKIVQASDNYPEPDQNLRKRILKSVGLEEI